MFEHNSFYRNYQRYNYNNYSTNRYNGYNTTFNPMYNYFYEQSPSYNNQQYTKDDNKVHEITDKITVDNDFKKREESDTKNFRIGPIEIDDNTINAFGFSIAIDDLIIIGLIILLFFQSDKDYTLIIILGLMLFNITFSSLDFFRGL